VELQRAPAAGRSRRHDSLHHSHDGRRLDRCEPGGVDVGDTLAFGIGRRRGGGVGEIAAEAIGAAEPRALSNEVDYQLRACRHCHDVGDGDTAVAHR